MPQIFANNATSTLASPITDSATALAVAGADATKFPAPGAGEFFLLTLTDGAGNREIVKVTARSGANMTTIERGQEDTAAQAWSAGVSVALRHTAGSFEALLQKTGGTMTGNITFGDAGEGIVFAGGGKIVDQSTGGNGNNGRTVAFANNESFDILTEAGGAYIVAIDYTAGTFTFKGNTVWHAGNRPAPVIQRVVAGTSPATFTVSADAIEHVISFNGLSHNDGGTPFFAVRLGDAGGVESTGYNSGVVVLGGAYGAAASGFLFAETVGNTVPVSGKLTLTKANATGEEWSADGKANIGTVNIHVCAGFKALSGPLTTIQVFTSASNFDAGTISVTSFF